MGVHLSRRENPKQPGGGSVDLSSKEEGELKDNITTSKQDKEAESVTRGEEYKQMVNHKETTWGPIIADRRSNRLRDDGKTVLEKAQNLKRKVNIEGNTCTTFSDKTFALNFADVLLITKNVDIRIGGDNEGSGALNNIIARDKDRNDSYKENCRDQECYNKVIDSNLAVGN